VGTTSSDPDDVSVEPPTSDGGDIDPPHRSPQTSPETGRLGSADELPVDQRPAVEARREGTPREGGLAPSTTAIVEPVPDDVRTEMRTAYGVDVD
jgi:hypothetical protein